MWLPPSLEVIASEFQDARIEEDPIDERIVDFLDRAYPLKDPSSRSREREPFTLAAVLIGIGYCFDPREPNCTKPADKSRVSRRLNHLGYEVNPHRTRANGRVPTWIARKRAHL
ncbi:MAG: hypothetical protein WB611_21010 [Stellaceae bacterium]